MIAGANGAVTAAASALVGEPLPAGAAAVPIGGLRRLDPAATGFPLGPEAQLQLLLPDLSHRRVTLVRPFPLRPSDEWLSVRGPDGREIGLLPGLGELDTASREAAEAHLRLRHFVPRITAIRGLRDESDGGRSGGLVWDLEADRGPTTLHMPNTNGHIQDLGGGRLLLSDRAGSRFEITSVSALDAASRARLSRTARWTARSCGGGAGGRVNPLQVRAEPEAGPGTAPSALASHLQRVRTFFSLYLPGLPDLERAALQEAVLAAYRDRGIGWRTDPAAVREWPTVADVYRHASGEPRLRLLLRDAAEGTDAALWAGQGAPPAGEFTVLDAHDLGDAADSVRRAQYFNVLGYAWDLVRRGRAAGRRTVLVVDEAWLLADPRTPEALGFLRDLSKRVRKYGGSLVVVTQHAVDFLAPELARLGQPVLSNASTKLLMRQEAKDIEALRDLLRLSEAECDLLTGARRGEGLLLAGNRRVRLRVEAAEHEVALIDAGR